MWCVELNIVLDLDGEKMKGFEEVRLQYFRGLLLRSPQFPFSAEYYYFVLLKNVTILYFSAFTFCGKIKGAREKAIYYGINYLYK